MHFVGLAALLAAAWLLGGGLLRRLVRSPLTGLERRLFALCLGLGSLWEAAFLLGLAGAYMSWALRGLLALAAFAGVLLRAVSPSPPPSAEPNPSQPVWVKIVIAGTALWMLGQLPAVLTPMVDYDGLAYHVGAPKRWLELGRITPLPTHLHTLWPMGEEMLNGILLTLGGDGACKPLMYGFALLGAAATYALGRRLAGPAVGACAAGILLYRAGAPSINTTSIEMPLTLYLVLAALALAIREAAPPPAAPLPGRRLTARGALLILAGLMAGFACSIKLTGLLGLSLLAAGLALIERRHARGPRAIAAPLGLAGIALLAALPWYARTAWITGNPVYPFAYAIFGGKDWSSDASRVLSLYFRSFDLPGADLVQRAAFVHRHVIKLVLLTAIGVGMPGSPRWLRGFALAAGIFCVAQAVTSDQPRFLLAATPFAAIALAWWVVRLASRWPVFGWAGALAFLLLVIPTTATKLRAAPRVPWSARARREFLLHYVNNVPALEWANRNLPSNGRILYGPDNRTDFLQRPVYWSSAVFQRLIRYDSPEVFRQSLAANGIRYLILNRDVYKDSAISFETQMGWRSAEKQRLSDAASRGQLLYSALGVDVYELAP